MIRTTKKKMTKATMATIARHTKAHTCTWMCLRFSSRTAIFALTEACTAERTLLNNQNSKQNCITYHVHLLCIQRFVFRQRVLFQDRRYSRGLSCRVSRKHEQPTKRGLTDVFSAVYFIPTTRQRWNNREISFNSYCFQNAHRCGRPVFTFATGKKCLAFFFLQLLV
jgi:hypothetical protein